MLRGMLAKGKVDKEEAQKMQVKRIFVDLPHVAKLCNENEVFLKFLGRSLESQLEWLRLKNISSLCLHGAFCTCYYLEYHI